jgi:hypothetical protein
MRRKVYLVLFLAICGGLTVAAEQPKKKPEKEKEYPLSDYLLFSAKSEKEILSWARGKSSFGNDGGERFDFAETERFKIDGKNLLVLLANRFFGTTRITIFVYVGDDETGWDLLLMRETNTADVKVKADKKAKQLLFRSKAGKLLLILPVENIELSPEHDEQSPELDGLR